MNMKRIKQSLIGMLALLVVAGQASAIDIVFDYSLDTNSFFDAQAKRDVLDAAASVFEIFTDNLEAIEPGTVYNAGTQHEFSDTWEMKFTHPSTGDSYSVIDMTIPEDVIVVYVGSRDLGGLTLGEGGPGGYDVNGIQSFVDSVESRGQSGAISALPDDFGPWGGAIAFDIDSQWHFGTGTTPGSSQTDFYSVAVHELAHLLGFGTATSFDLLVAGTSFTGAEAVEVFGSNPPLNYDQAHWQTGTTSFVPDGGPQETSMDPDIADGEVKHFTLLDYAAMADIGWEVPSMSAEGIEGDLNSDGFVGLDDLDLVLGNWNQNVAPGDPLLGDPSGDGFVGLDDLDLILNNWNQGTPPTALVPEPGTLILLGLGGWALLARRQSAV